MESLKTSLFQHFPYGRLVLAVGGEQELTVCFCNDVGAQFYGLSGIHHLHGKQLHHIILPHVADFLASGVRECCQQQKLIVKEPHDVHVLIDSKQSLVFNPIFGKDGDVTHVDIMALPIDADKVELQKERDHALMLMTAAFDASNLGIFVTDRNRRILRINEAFMREFGFKRRDLVGHDFTKVFTADDRRVVAKLYNDYLHGQAESRREWQIIAPDETKYQVLVTSAPLHLHPDRPLVVHTFVDISEHKSLEESLRWAKEQADSANRAKSAFLASMSHELRTPLNAIIGFSEMMRGEIFGVLGHEKYAEYMKDIHFAAEHLLDIINDVLDMSKIEAGKFELSEEDVDINSFFESIERVMGERAAIERIKLVTEIDPDVELVHMDKRVMRQMLFNLLSNSIKFSPSGSMITVATHIQAKTGNILFSVADQGRGIAPQDLEHVMEPFNRGQAMVSDGAGTGLGLPLTRAMAELHGGYLTIQSEVGKGTTVTITLPSDRLRTSPSYSRSKSARSLAI
jgi:PAS domain S-box-containing protein